MWQEIERISGLPFPQHSPSGVDSELYVDRARSVTSLITDFHLASEVNNINEAETGQLQQELLRATNHAVAVQIEVHIYSIFAEQFC